MLKNKWWNVALCLSVLLFSYVYIANAWVVDDAYITFRTVDNFVHGHGLRWNVAERVQVYTHPLWMFLISLFCFFTSDVFYTSIVVSYVLCVAMLLVAGRRLAAEAPWKPVLFVATLLASKTVVDYTSSGLETPLSYLLVVLFYSEFLRRPKHAVSLSPGGLFYLLLVAALAFVNRYDTILLYVPALVYLCWVYAPRLRWRFVAVGAAAGGPAILWMLFSLLYYGSLVPNTAYAKAVNATVPFADKLSRGCEYFAASLSWDAAGPVVLLLAIGLAFRGKSGVALLSLAGAALYLVYVLTAAAAATHLGGRFLAVPLLIAFLVFASLVTSGRAAALCAGVLLVYVVWSPLSPIKMGTRSYEAPLQSGNHIDANWFVHEEGAALMCFRKGALMPDHRWFRAGRRFRDTPVKVHAGGESGVAAIGYFGYAAGPDKHIVDRCGLADPLLARLPSCGGRLWKSGHFWRAVPRGYLESLRTSRNEIHDPALGRYYDKVRSITRGRLLDRRRLWDIVEMNLGRYQHLVDAYVSTEEFAEGNARCRQEAAEPPGPVYPIY